MTEILKFTEIVLKRFTEIDLSPNAQDLQKQGKTLSKLSIVLLGSFSLRVFSFLSFLANQTVSLMDNKDASR